MTRGVSHVTVPVRFTAEIRGGRVLAVLKRAGVPRLFAHRPASGGDPCWTFPAARVADVMAAASTLRGCRVVLDHEQETLL